MSNEFGDWGLGTGDLRLGTGDWGLGDWRFATGDWGLGEFLFLIPYRQSPIANPYKGLTTAPSLSPSVPFNTMG